MDMRYLNARWTLGWALIKHVLLRPFVRRDPRKWVLRFSQESLGPTPADAWNFFAPSSRCIGCGLCDAVVPSDMQPSRWIMSVVRQPGDAPLALDKAHKLRLWAKEIERVCPTRVQVEAVVRLIEADTEALRADPFTK